MTRIFSSPSLLVAATLLICGLFPSVWSAQSESQPVYVAGRSAGDGHFEFHGRVLGPRSPLSPTDTSFAFSTPGPWPTGLAFDGTFFWLADATLLRIYKLDGQGAVVDSFPSPNLSPAALEWDGQNLWLVCEQLALLYKIDPGTGQATDSLWLPDTASFDPNSWGLAWDGQYLWHSQYGSSARIFKIDPASGDTLFSFEPPSDFILGLAWRGGYLTGVDVNNGTFYWMDPQNGAVVDSLPWYVPYPLGLDFDSVNDVYWNVSSDTSFGGNQAVYRIDSIITRVDEPDVMPREILMFSAYPNPFNSSTTFRYSLSSPAFVRLEIFNLLGQHLTTVTDGLQQPQAYNVTWAAVDLPSGVYLARIEVGGLKKAIKLNLLK